MPSKDRNKPIVDVESNGNVTGPDHDNPTFNGDTMPNEKPPVYNSQYDSQYDNPVFKEDHDSTAL